MQQHKIYISIRRQSPAKVPYLRAGGRATVDLSRAAAASVALDSPTLAIFTKLKTLVKNMHPIKWFSGDGFVTHKPPAGGRQQCVKTYVWKWRFYLQSNFRRHLPLLPGRRRGARGGDLHRSVGDKRYLMVSDLFVLATMTLVDGETLRTFRAD